MGKLQNILILINLAVALLGGGLVFYAHNIIKPPPTDLAAETESLKTSALEQAQVRPVPIKKIVVNLHSRESRLRYLDVEMNILTFREEQKEIVKANEHIFKDVLIQVASHLIPEDLDTLSGKILLESRLKKQVNTKLGQPVVKQIFFSGFVVQ